MKKVLKENVLTYKDLLLISENINPWQDKLLIDRTYEFLSNKIVGEKTKILSSSEISNIEKINKKIDNLFKINLDKSESIHNEKQLANMTNFEAMDIFLNYSTKTNIILEDSQNINLSVILPLFRAKNIAWVAFESLIRQEDINFNWELIVIEEQFESPFGFDEILKYKEKLKDIGCVNIRYIALDKWIPLSAKWYFLIQECNEHSEMIAFCAADMYQSKKRLSKQYEDLKTTNKNWHKIGENIIYDLDSDVHVIFPVSEDRNDSCSVMASKDLVNKLPLICLKKHVDSWLYNTLLNSGLDYFYDDESDLKYDTINVNGINNLSIGRENNILEVKPPLRNCCQDLVNHLPEEIAQKFSETRKYVKSHKEEIIQSKIKLRIKDHLK